MKKNTKIKAGQESLAEILRRLEPYMPKTPKAEEKETKHWKVVSNGALPPLTSVGLG